MGDDTGDRGAGDGSGASARRDFLRKAAVAGATAFAVPMIATVDPADAQAVTSPPPEPPGPPGPTTPVEPAAGTPVEPAAGTPGGGDVSPAGRSTRRGELPRTGSDLDNLVAAGLAATAGGAALVLWSADRKANARPAVDPPEPPDPEAAT